jgi:hypothetical protein
MDRRCSYRDLGAASHGLVRAVGTRVRVLLLAVLLPACSLYFSHPPSDDVVTGDDYPLPDSAPAGESAARCEGGTIYAIGEAQYEPAQPTHGSGTVIGHCANACRSAAVVCADATCSNAEAALCNASASLGHLCELEGDPCSGDGTIDCPVSTTCGTSEAAYRCSCIGAHYACSEVAPVVRTQTALVGTWQGTVTPPSFAAPGQVSLWIYPDGTYWAQAETTTYPVFYYGGDGPWPSRTIEVLSSTTGQGAWANIGIFFGSDPPNIGAIDALVVDDTHLRFTYYASWFGCNQPFYYDHARTSAVP